MSDQPVYSIVVPVYNEEPIIDELYRRMAAVMDGMGESWELVLVNDGSQDRSLELMMALHARDPRVHVVSFARNFGHQTAVTAGLDYAQGQAVVIIDADLQDPPELIPQMVEKWREGYQVVYAVRTERRGESRFKLFTARLFYRLIYRITDVDMPLDTGDFRLMDRVVVDSLNRMREHNRFIRGMTSWVGFTQTGVGYVREERYAGVTKYPLRKMIRFAMDAITGFSYFPLQIAIYFSLVLGIIAVLAIPVVVLLRVATGQEVFEGQATTLVVLLLVSSVQFLLFFLLGQYISRIYDEVRDRPLYIVAQAVGFERKPAPPGMGHAHHET
ncbi:MAG: glycosyltransferase family 2 protein [Anaerolineae bacterium]|nr:glycosyltransferase family 2 protein [Anaerolineae bacterium]